MTEEEILTIKEIQAKNRAFSLTHAGRAMVRYENALGRAWITDQNERSSDRAMKRDWDMADAARKELRERIEELQSVLKAMVDRWEPDCVGTDRVMWGNAIAALMKVEDRS